MLKTGILIQGKIYDWTVHIIKKYFDIFPNSEIVLSTWTNEKIDNIPCIVIQTDPPEKTDPYYTTVNHQKKGALEGLKVMTSDLIMKCRTDQFILNDKIFELYSAKCMSEKIMIPNYPTVKNMDYFASDFCQIATKNILEDYWNGIPFYDGSFEIHPETWLASNYIIKNKQCYDSWQKCMDKYYLVQDFFSDFNIVWKKLYDDSNYMKTFKILYPNCKFNT